MRVAADLAGTFLELPHGIPSHDTFECVFARLDPQQLEGCFARWMQSLAAVLRARVMSVEGKAACRSHDTGRVCHPCTWPVLGRAQHTRSWASSGWTTTPMKSRPFQNCSRCWYLRATKSPGPPSLKAFRRSLGLAGD